VVIIFFFCVVVVGDLKVNFMKSDPFRLQ